MYLPKYTTSVLKPTNIKGTLWITFAESMELEWKVHRIPIENIYSVAYLFRLLP
jgi:hypothetical protein